eukprot:10839909-Alexandrium_andersonii.AAC.1
MPGAPVDTRPAFADVLAGLVASDAEDEDVAQERADLQRLAVGRADGPFNLCRGGAAGARQTRRVRAKRQAAAAASSSAGASRPLLEVLTAFLRAFRSMDAAQADRLIAAATALG